ncbi:MAG: hypothetical protein EB136_08310 [Synechococcaceae bacterium WBB_3_034]|nr:hypothetical protein [Synechococcaceae bacterium WBB_3_034]
MALSAIECPNGVCHSHHGGHATLVDGALNAVESFLHSSEVQRLFVQELVRGTVAESESDPLSRQGVRQLIEQELLALLQEQREALVDRVAEGLLDQADGNFERAQRAASAGIEEVQHLLVNHAEAMG